LAQSVLHVGWNNSLRISWDRSESRTLHQASLIYFVD